MTKQQLEDAFPVYAKYFMNETPAFPVNKFYLHGMKGEASFAFAEGKLLVVSQLTRDQHRNVEDAREKVRALVRQALVRPVPRRKTKPTRGSVERRIEHKKRHARTKALRRGDD